MNNEEIKVLHLSAGDLNGGAARGAYSLHRGLLMYGVHSRFLCGSFGVLDQTVYSAVKDVRGKLKSILRQRMDIAPTLFYPNRKKMIFSTGLFGYNFLKTKAYSEADIINLHWVNGGFVSMRTLLNINKPIVWTIRDMWPMTGGCHYSMGCDNYIDYCGRCPQLNSNSNLDLSRFVINFKKRSIPKTVRLIGISNWLIELAKKSTLFKSYDMRVIFNNIDTQDFFPIEKETARLVLNLNTRKKIILVGAQTLDDFYKGFDKFIEATSFLNKENFYLCFFGVIDQKKLVELGFEFSVFGFLKDIVSLRLVYSAADVFVAPSIMEAFGKTLSESMACGTPVVCFDAAGPRDIVDHMLNGYRAIPFESSDLARGIEWVCYNQKYAELGISSREKIVSTFDVRVIAKEYINLYQEILAQ